jgi:hypothetical protein
MISVSGRTCQQIMTNGASGLKRMARATSLGRVRSITAAMITPLNKPMAIGALASP